jgi:predicted nucleotidyltransferase
VVLPRGFLFEAMNTNQLPTSSQALDAILKRYGVVDVSVFGSFARGVDMRPESDIDLLVTYKPGTTLFDVANLQEELEKAFGRKVDLVSRKHLSKRLAERIKQDIRPLSSVL